MAEAEVEHPIPDKNELSHNASEPGDGEDVDKHDSDHEVGDMGVSPAKKARGTHKGTKGTKTPIKTPVKKKSAEGRGRPKGAKNKTDSEKSPERKKRPPKVPRERTIAPGTLRDKPRLSYKDESSSEEEQTFYGEPVSSDSEADYRLEKRLSGAKKPAKKESGALRERPKLSYKNESAKKRGRGRSKPTQSSPRKSPSASPEKKKSKVEVKPKKSAAAKEDKPSDSQATARPRGRPKVHKVSYLEVSESESEKESEEETMKDKQKNDKTISKETGAVKDDVKEKEETKDEEEEGDSE